LNQYMESFVRKIHFQHHKFFKGKRRKIVTYHKCIKNFIMYRGVGFARGKINLGTLDILELAGRLQGKEEAINRRIIDKQISTINQRNEFRSFFFFLEKEYSTTYFHLPFIKSERPDFILRYNDEIIGIEITEAINAGDAEQRSKVYKSDLRGRKAKEIEQYIDQTPVLSSEEPKTPLNKLITKRLKDKKEKFEHFQPVDREVLIIIANHYGFKNARDIEKIRKLLERQGSLKEDPFSLVVMNLIHGVYAHYRWKAGEVIVEKNEGMRKKNVEPIWEKERKTNRKK